MNSVKLAAGDVFPKVTAFNLKDEQVTLSEPHNGCDWMMLLVYRGRHCPMCTKYLNQLEEHYLALRDIGIDLVAVSGDSKVQLQAHTEKLEVSFPLHYGLTLEQMQQLGLYISHPRSEQETDHLFPEPGLFVINELGELQVVDISNNPFVRPDQATLLSGLTWIRNPDNNYPIRGTFRYP